MAAPGDYDLDNDVDVLDLQHVAYRWNTKQSDALYDPAYDTDSNGEIDIADVQRVAYRLGTLCQRTALTRSIGLGRWHSSQITQTATVELQAISNTLATGDVFTVGLNISNVAELGAFAFSLGYSSTQFEVLSVSLSDFAESTERTVATLDWVTRTTSLSSSVSFSAYSLGQCARRGQRSGPVGRDHFARIGARAQHPGVRRYAAQQCRR